MKGGTGRSSAPPLAPASGARALHGAWIVILVSASVATAVPWLLGALDIDLAPLAWAVLVLAAAHAGAALALRERSEGALVAAISWFGIAGLGVVWLLAGGTQNPAFLATFFLPVVASGLLAQRWRPYALALWTVTVVAAVALLDEPSLRWHLARLGLPLDGLWALFPDRPEWAPDPFPALAAHPRFVFASLVLFSLLLFAAAYLSRAVGASLLGLAGRATELERAAEEAESLALRVVESIPQPAVILTRPDGRIEAASRAFHEELLLERRQVAGVELLELLDFARPELVAPLLAEGGDLAVASLRVGPELRHYAVSARALTHDGLDRNLVLLRDVTERVQLEAALDAMASPLIMLGPLEEVAYANRAARERFPSLEVGALAQEVLPAEGAPAGWWRAGRLARHRRRVRLGPVESEVELLGATAPGSHGRLTLLRLEAGDVQ